MRRLFSLAAVVVLTSAGLVNPLWAHVRRPPPTPEEIAWSQQAARIRATLRTLKQLPPSLPPAPAGVTDLGFAEFFGPIGSRGLEYSTKLRALDGHRVRIFGYMVKQQTRLPGCFLLTSLPVATDEPEYGQCDELPAATLHVFVADTPEHLVPLAAGQVVLIGRLELGARLENDGRTSVARLFLEPKPPGESPVAVAATTR